MSMYFIIMAFKSSSVKEIILTSETVSYKRKNALLWISKKSFNSSKVYQFPYPFLHQ